MLPSDERSRQEHERRMRILLNMADVKAARHKLDNTRRYWAAKINEAEKTARDLEDLAPLRAAAALEVRDSDAAFRFELAKMGRE
jgi:hypothetical protein